MGTIDNKESYHGLKVDNDISQAIIKIMKKKRITAWILYFVSMFLVVGVFVFLIQRWAGGIPMYLMLPIFIVLLLLGIITLSASKSMEKALLMNNQSAFDVAMSKWNKRCMLTFGGYVLFALLVVGFLMRIIGIGQ